MLNKEENGALANRDIVRSGDARFDLGADMCHRDARVAALQKINTAIVVNVDLRCDSTDWRTRDAVYTYEHARVTAASLYVLTKNV